MYTSDYYMIKKATELDVSVLEDVFRNVAAKGSEHVDNLVNTVGPHVQNIKDVAPQYISKAQNLMTENYNNMANAAQGLSTKVNPMIENSRIYAESAAAAVRDNPALAAGTAAAAILPGTAAVYANSKRNSAVMDKARAAINSLKSKIKR